MVTQEYRLRVVSLWRRRREWWCLRRHREWHVPEVVGIVCCVACSEFRFSTRREDNRPKKET